MSPANLIISAVICVAGSAIVIACSKGRISRDTYIKHKLSLAALLLISWGISAILLRAGVITGTLIIGIIITPVIIFRMARLDVQRLHDLDCSGWCTLLNYVPLAGLYFMYLRFCKKSQDAMNDYDIALDYAMFLKKSRLYPQVNCITLTGKDFIFNTVHFEYRKNGGREQYECSALALEMKDKNLERYCNEHLVKVENAPGYASQYRVSFLEDGNLIQTMRKDLHAIVTTEGFLLIDEKETFIRRDGFSYMLIYCEDFIIPQLDAYTKRQTVDGYCCITLSAGELAQLIKSISLLA